jgi:hypothetical protein
MRIYIPHDTVLQTLRTAVVLHRTEKPRRILITAVLKTARKILSESRDAPFIARTEALKERYVHRT